VRQQIVDADSPALEPKKPSNAGPKSPVDRPRRYSSGSTSVTFGERRMYPGSNAELNLSPSRWSSTRGAFTSTMPAPVITDRPRA
jgi:hypothetical protein